MYIHIWFEVLTVVMRYNAVCSVESQPAFERNMTPLPTRSKNNQSKKPEDGCHMIGYRVLYPR
jgi:hypothetical protein